MSVDRAAPLSLRLRRSARGAMHRYPHALLVGIILLGACLRFLRLDWQDIWLDEAFSLHMASLPWNATLAALQQDVHPPLFYALLHVWLSVLGDSAYALRLLSVMTSVLALPVLYTLGRALRLERPWSRLLTFLLAVAYFHVRFAQETRSFSLLVLLTLLSMLGFVRWLARRQARTLLLTALVSAALVYTHYYGPLVLLVQSAWLAWHGRSYRAWLWPWTLALAGVGLAFWPWLSIVQQQARTLPSLTHQTPFALATLGDLLYRFSGRSGLLAVLCCLLIGLPRLAARWPGAARALGLTRARPPLPLASLLLLWLTLPVLLPLLFSGLAATFTYRNAIISLPAFWLLVVMGWRQIRAWRVHGVLLALVLTLSLPGLFRYYVEPDKEQWRAAVAWIAQVAQPGDLILFDTGPTRQPFEIAARATLMTLPRETFPNFEGDPAAFVRRYARQYPRIWLIATVYGEARLDWRLGLLAPYYRLQGLMPFTDVMPVLLERRP
ncbi:MAG: glycosyltransferase family 39 protein [Anaerolineae bacterium]